MADCPFRVTVEKLARLKTGLTVVHYFPLGGDIIIHVTIFNLMVVDFLCIVVLFHFHFVTKLVFKECLSIKKWHTRLISGLAALTFAIIFLEFFIFCGLPESLSELVSFRCRDPSSILIEYLVVLMLAAADFLSETDYFAKKKKDDDKKPQSQRRLAAKQKKSFRKSFLVLASFTWLTYLNETDSDVFNLQSIYDSIPKPWQKRPPLHPGSKRVKARRKKAAARRKQSNI